MFVALEEEEEETLDYQRIKLVIMFVAVKIHIKQITVKPITLKTDKYIGHQVPDYIYAGKAK